jgi:uncharacterized protein with von Willebrand factor type A (vWA) domain
MTDPELRSTRQRIEQDDFFARMDDFGFFESVAEHLPDDFTAVYEIARVLENAEHPLGRVLAPVLSVALSESSSQPNPDTIPNIVPAEEYEADLIQSVQEVPRVYPHQFLLPDTVFFQKLVERSLWLPRARAPQTYRFQSESETFKPDYRKQKVYVLFDVSRSMNMRWRIHLAKAIAVVFLQRNRKELGTVYLRNFAETVHELQEAHDLPSYNNLISSIMHVKADGKGTVLQRAVLTAIEDIRKTAGLIDSEILVITDGAAHIELKKVKDALGDDIKLHTVKIGDEHIEVDAKFVEYHLRDANTEDAERLRTLLEKKRSLEAQAAAATGGTLKARLTQELSGVQRQVAVLTDRVGDYIREHYGKEIVELSHVYVNVDDIDPRNLLKLSDERLAELEKTADALLQALHIEKLTDDLKRAAVLYDHLELLLEYSNDQRMERLRAQKRDLEQLMQRVLSTDGDDAVDDIHISEFDTDQLRNMLSGTKQSNSRIPFAKLLRALVRKVRAWLVRRREERRARQWETRKMRRY